MIELNNISKSFKQSDKDLIILKDINLSVSAAENVTIMGPSGSGKSTLLKVLAGLEKPSSGQVIIDNQNIVDYTEEQAAQHRSKKIGYIFQDHRLLPQCNVLENILLPTISEHKKTPKTTIEKAHNLISEIGLENRMNHNPQQLSGGECQRVAIIRALINDPKIILADEPTGSLDYENAHLLMELLSRLSKTHQKTLITVTHDKEMLKYSERCIRLNQGELTES